MKLVSKLSIVATAMLMAACAPRDTTHYYSIQDALNSSEAKEIIRRIRADRKSTRLNSSHT